MTTGRIIRRSGPRGNLLPIGVGGPTFDYIIGLNATDIQALPSSGSPYTNVLGKANATITPSSTDIGSQEGYKAFAAGLIYVYKLTNDPSNANTYKNKVIAALQTITDPSTGWLTISNLDHQIANRMTAGWVLAADLVGYHDQQMIDFATNIRTKVLTGFTYNTMVSCAQNFSGNHGTLAKASLMACDLYLKTVGIGSGIANHAWVPGSHYCYCGDVTHGFGTYATHNGETHTDGYSIDSSGYTYEQTWGLNPVDNGWTPITTGTGDPTKDGALVMEVCRVTSSANTNYSVDGSGNPVWGNDYVDTNGDANGAEYFFTNMHGSLVVALLLEKHGYGDVWTWGNNGMLRAWQYVIGNPTYWYSGGATPWSHRFTANAWVDSLVNRKYPGQISASGFPVAASGGYGFGFTDWLVI